MLFITSFASSHAGPKWPAELPSSLRQAPPSAGQSWRGAQVFGQVDWVLHDNQVLEEGDVVMPRGNSRDLETYSRETARSCVGHAPATCPLREPEQRIFSSPRSRCPRLRRPLRQSSLRPKSRYAQSLASRPQRDQGSLPIRLRPRSARAAPGRESPR